MEIITINKVKLIKWLRGDDYILQHVQSRKLITVDEYTTLKHTSEPGTQVRDLLDLMLTKGQRVCIDFLDLLKDDDVNESHPELREWVASVSTSEIKAAPQSSVQSSGSSVSISANNASNICSPIISSSEISDLNMNVSIVHQKWTDEKPLTSYDRTLNNNPRITDNLTFLRKNRADLIDKIKNVDRIVDDLNFTDEMAANVRVERTDQAKMRTVLDYTKSKKAYQLLVDALYKHAADVMEDLTPA